MVDFVKTTYAFEITLKYNFHFFIDMGRIFFYYAIKRTAL